VSAKLIPLAVILGAYTLFFAIVNARQEIGADAAKDENERPNERALATSAALGRALATSAALGSLFRSGYGMACCAFFVAAEGCCQDMSENERRDVETTARPI
jgi:hypothetical protein